MFQFTERVFKNAYKWANPSIQVSFVTVNVTIVFLSRYISKNELKDCFNTCVAMKTKSNLTYSPYNQFILFSPAELQYYTSLYSLVIQIPCLFFLIDWGNLYSILTSENDESTQLSAFLHMAFFYLINGIFFHFQTITAYVLMDFISPVTHRYA